MHKSDINFCGEVDKSVLNIMSFASVIYEKRCEIRKMAEEYTNLGHCTSCDVRTNSTSEVDKEDAVYALV